MSSSRASEVVFLYRAVLRLGKRQLKLTDQDFFKRVVGAEFRKYRSSSDEVDFQLEVISQYSASFDVVLLARAPPLP